MPNIASMKTLLGISRGFVLCLVAAAFCAVSCSRRAAYREVSGFAQGGTYSVKYRCPAGVDAAEVGRQVDSILDSIDRTLSGYNKGSLLSRFNAGEKVVPNAMLKEIFALSKSLYEETGGALDMASGPLFNAWGFGFTRDSLPSAATVDSLKAICGMDKFDGGMNPVVEGICPALNFNAIAQGYTCDKIAGYLHSLGVTDMLVEIGEIYCEGLSPSGKPWTIAVDRPEDDNQVPGSKGFAGIWQGDGSGRGVVTSGNYRKFYIKDGKKYSHTIDPRTGYPVEHSLLSATVVAPDAALADAYATYCMVIGLEQAEAFIESRPDLEAYLVYSDGNNMAEWASSGFNLVR